MTGAILLAVLAAAPARAAAVNPSVDELCALYQDAATTGRIARSEYVERILSVCAEQTPARLRDAAQPAFNFRPTFPGQPDAAVFRAGQPAPRALESGATAHYDARNAGYDFAAAKAKYGVDVVVDLRFDPTWKPYTEVFGAGETPLPLSPGEARYRYALERDFVESHGMKSVYAPTPPELEHFVGNYVPRLDAGKNPRPYVCRLPQGVPDGAVPHWLNEDPRLLRSADPECRDLWKRYGRKQVLAWVAETRRASARANKAFLDAATLVSGFARDGRKVVYHCAGGTDRAGRVSAVLELREYGVSKQDLQRYSGPLSDPKLDLIAVNYLLSQRAGSDSQYRYLFPDLKDARRGWLYSSL